MFSYFFAHTQYISKAKREKGVLAQIPLVVVGFRDAKLRFNVL
jgi:hypothetical protein